MGSSTWVSSGNRVMYMLRLRHRQDFDIFCASTSRPQSIFHFWESRLQLEGLSTFKRGILTKETSSVFLEDSPSCRKSLSPECARTSNNFWNTPMTRRSETSSRPSNSRSASRITILSVTSVSLVPLSCQRCRGRTWPSGTTPNPITDCATLPFNGHPN